MTQVSRPKRLRFAPLSFQTGQNSYRALSPELSVAADQCRQRHRISETAISMSMVGLPGTLHFAALRNFGQTEESMYAPLCGGSRAVALHSCFMF
jgi:hypothetical protein